MKIKSKNNKSKRDCKNFIYADASIISIISIFIMLFLFGCITPKLNQSTNAENSMNVSLNVSSSVSNKSTTVDTTIFTNVTNATNITNTSEANNRISLCLTSYQIPTNAIIFIYADWCPHCAKMKPLVKQLEEEGYNIFWANAENGEMVAKLRECLSGIAQLKYIPEFVCAKTKADKVGEFSDINEMRSFFQSCLH